MLCTYILIKLQNKNYGNAFLGKVSITSLVMGHKGILWLQICIQDGILPSR